MNTFNWFKAIAYGVITWAVAGIALWLLTLTGLGAGWTHGIVAAVFGVTAYLLALDVRPAKIGHALGYGLVFVAIGMALDALLVRTLDAHIFTTWQYYVGYALAFVAPLLRLELPKVRLTT
jgi:hypothetical protein